MQLANLKIGTKIIIAIVSIILICMILLSYVINEKSHSILMEESHKLLENTARRAANLTQGNIQGSYTSLNVTYANVQQLIFDDIAGKELLIEQELSNMVDKVKTNIFGYIYLRDTYLFANNPKYAFNDNEAMLFAHDSDMDRDGGIVIQGVHNEILQSAKIQEALQTGKPTIGSPNHFIFQNKEYYISSLNIPLFNKNNKIIGVIGVYVDLDGIRQKLFNGELSVFKNDYLSLLDSNSKLLIHPKKEYQGKTLLELNKDTSTQQLADMLKQHKDGVVEYKNLAGDLSYTGVASFEIGENSGIYWAIIK